VCLRYLLDVRGLKADVSTFFAALMRGNLSCLECVLDHYSPTLALFPDDEDYHNSMDQVFRPGNPFFIECVKLAVKHGWRANDVFVKYALNRDGENCEDYFQEQGWIEAAGLYKKQRV